MLGSLKLGGSLCEKAEEMGYSRDLCSYARADIACSIVNAGPVGGLPEPDFLVCCNNICGTVMKWYEVQARRYRVPLFIFDTPFIHTEFSDEARRYVRRQVDEYLLFLEEQCGKKLESGRMDEAGKLSVQAQRLWQEVLDSAVHRPAPMSAFDAFFHMALIVTLRGTKLAVEYYTELRDEMRDRIGHGISSVPDEKYRLVWDNLPVWHRIKWLSDAFASHDACLVADTYTAAWSGVAELIDENNFLESMSIAYASVYLNISIDRMSEILKKILIKYSAEGLVMHSNRSCKPYSLGQQHLAGMVTRELGIPALLIESDMADERNFSEGQIRTRIDAFMEMIKGGVKK